LTILENTAGPEHPRVAEIAQHYATMLERLGRHAEAAALRPRVTPTALASTLPVS
jgi:hypothetical protein